MRDAAAGGADQVLAGVCSDPFPVGRDAQGGI